MATPVKQASLVDNGKPAVQPGPRNLTEALAAVMGELGGIEKLTAAERRRRGLSGGDEGVPYAYRGIDQISAAVQPLFAKYGVVIVPQLRTYEVREVTVNNRPWTDTIVVIDWMISGPEGSTFTATTAGAGRDNSDKGLNKATTAAYKNLLLRLLTIGDPDDDADGHTHERDASNQTVEVLRDPADVLFEAVRARAGTPVAGKLKALADIEGKRLSAAAFRADSDWAATVARTLAEADEVAS